MASVVSPPVARAGRSGRLDLRVDVRAVSAWVLAGALILYLGFNGGGYGFASYGQAGIVVWWIVVLTAAWGLLPKTALSRAALLGMLSFGAFTAWTALGITWSISSGLSFQDLALVTSYFGILVLGVSIHGDRSTGVRHTVAAAATAVVVLAAFSLATRLFPGFIPSARTGYGSETRLEWPLGYWNALASLAVLGLPLLLSIAVSARRLISQAAAAGAIPIVVLCGALTQSRGGLIAGAAALLVWFCCAPQRIPKLATAVVVAAGSAALVAIGLHDRTIRLAQTGAAERHQAGTLVLATVVICILVGLGQLGLGLLLRRVISPRLSLSPPRRTALALLGVALAGLIVAALVLGVPHTLSQHWTDFKNPVDQNTSASHLAATSGEGRYQYWVAGIDSAKSHVLVGSGPGTYQQDWLPRAHIRSYVKNAHNLYVETYTELGLVGLVLLAVFIAVLLGACLQAVFQTQGDDRARLAGVTATLVAFFIGAVFDWLWQMPVLVSIVLLLAAAVLAPTARDGADGSVSPVAPAAAGAGARRLSQPGRRTRRVVLALTGVAALAGVAYPLAVNTDITNSQSASDRGNARAALTDARSAVNLEPDSAEAEIQLALVLESDRAFTAALAPALKAVHVEAKNWTNWLILSRLDAETGHPDASVVAFRRARSLNPESPLFDS